MELTARIPMINKAFVAYTPASVPTRRGSHEKLIARFDAFVQQSARLNNVPDSLIYSILLTENEAGKADFVNYIQATGLGQIRPLTALETIMLCHKKKILTPEKRAVLEKRLGAAMLDRIARAGSGPVLRTIMPNATMVNHLKDAEFNIMLCGMILSLLIADHSPGGIVRLDYVVALYNQGFYALRAGSISKTLTTDELLTSRLKPEGKNYILKIVGKHGWLDIIA